jgi:hypothetical protein
MSDNYRHTGGYMNIMQLRKFIEREEVDYQLLLSALSDYAYPRDKISSWLKSGELIRVKKGLYVFGKNTALKPYSPELLANLIYGPSAISLNYALSFYGLIPERTTTITSITNKRNKTFATPIGDFTYRYLTPSKYAVGIELFNPNEATSFLIASPEKALCDLIYLSDKKIKLSTATDINNYLFGDLRIDEEILTRFRIKLLTEIAYIYQDPRLQSLKAFIEEWQNNA